MMNDDEERKFSFGQLSYKNEKNDHSLRIKLFKALIGVNDTLVKSILDECSSTNFVLNVPFCFGQTTSHLKPRGDNLLQHFSFPQNVTAVCYLFERLDEFREVDFNNATVILKVKNFSEDSSAL